jgi:hypothetical protein
MTTDKLELTAADFTERNGRLEYAGIADLSDYQGSVEIADDLGWVWFDRLGVSGSIIAGMGTSIEANESVESGGSVETGKGITAGLSIQCKRTRSMTDTQPHEGSQRDCDATMDIAEKARKKGAHDERDRLLDNIRAAFREAAVHRAERDKAFAALRSIRDYVGDGSSPLEGYGVIAVLNTAREIVGDD